MAGTIEALMILFTLALWAVIGSFLVDVFRHSH